MNSLVQLSSLIVTLLSLGIALHILFTGRNRNTSVLFFGMMLSCIVWNITLYLNLPIYPGYTLGSLNLFARISYGFTIIENFLLIYFCSEVLFKLEKITLFKRQIRIPHFLKVFFLVESILLTLVCIFSPLVYESIILSAGNYMSDNFGLLYPWYISHIVVCTLSSVFILYVKYHTAIGLVKKKLHVLFLTLLISHLLAQFFNIVLPVFGNTDFYLWGGMSYIIFFLGVLYITIKYRFLGSRLVFWRILHVLSQLAIVGFFVFLSFIAIDQTPFLKPYASVILICISILIYVLVTSFFLPKFYLGKDYSSFEKAVKETIIYLKNLHNVKELEQYMSTIFAKELAIEKVEIYVIANTLEYINIAKYPENELTFYLETTKSEIVSDEWHFGELSLTKKQLEVLVHLTILDSALCIPLLFQNKLVGILNFGRKSSGEPYYSAETALFLRLADYLSASLVNISLFQKEQVTNEELIRTKELASTNLTAKRLMHDMKNSLQSAYAVIREVKESKDIHKVGKVEEKLWDLEDSLSSRDNELQETDVDISDFLIHIAESFKELFQEKTIEYTYAIDIPPKTFIRCDRKKYKSIFDNLLHNASKFTPEGGKVIFRALQNVQNTELLVTISNTGEGVPENEKEKIFEVGFTKDTLRGTGLGLSVVKKFVELHKGEIHEFGTEGKDTVFTIKLPIIVPDIIIFDRKKK